MEMKGGIVARSPSFGLKLSLGNKKKWKEDESKTTLHSPPQLFVFTEVQSEIKRSEEWSETRKRFHQNCSVLVPRLLLTPNVFRVRLSFEPPYLNSITAHKQRWSTAHKRIRNNRPILQERIKHRLVSDVSKCPFLFLCFLNVNDTLKFIMLLQSHFQTLLVATSSV